MSTSFWQLWEAAHRCDTRFGDNLREAHASAVYSHQERGSASTPAMQLSYIKSLRPVWRHDPPCPRCTTQPASSSLLGLPRQQQRQSIGSILASQRPAQQAKLPYRSGSPAVQATSVPEREAEAAEPATDTASRLSQLLQMAKKGLVVGGLVLAVVRPESWSFIRC